MLKTALRDRRLNLEKLCEWRAEKLRVFQCWKGAGESISTQNSTHLQQTTCFDNESKIKVPDIKLLIIFSYKRKQNISTANKSEIKVKDIKLIGDIRPDRDSGFHEGMKNIGGGKYGAFLECTTQNPLRGQPLAPGRERCQQKALSLGLQRVACLPCSKSSPPQVSPPNKWIRGRLKRHSDQCRISRRPASSVVPPPLPAVSKQRDGWDEGMV